jgi:Acetyltransferase (GNAT) family
MTLALVRSSFMVREPVDDDLPYLFSTYLECLRKESAQHGQIPGHIFFPNQRRVFEGILRHGRVLVACLDEGPAAIVGWLSYIEDPLNPALHFVYTKHPFRRMGVATTLLEAAGLRGNAIQHSHSTVMFKALAKLFKCTHFNPYLQGEPSGRTGKEN